MNIVIAGIRLLITGMIPCVAIAQCGMTVGPPFESPGCDGFSGSVWMSTFISGGTPPYTITYSGIQGVPWTSSSTSVNKVVWSNCPSVMSCANPPHTATVHVTDAMGCTASNSASVGGFAVGPFWPGARSISSDCLVGAYTVSFTPTGGDVSLSWWAQSGDTQATYSLARNGASYASGPLNTVLLTNPYRLVFPTLPSGAYSLNITLPGMTSTTRWCPTTYQNTFFLPNVGDCGSNFRMKAALCGTLPAGGLMNDGLRTQNLVPTTEPYSALGYTYTGSTAGATIPASLLTITGNDAVVDWVLVELCATAAPYAVVYSRPALIQRDGDLIDLDGDDYLNVPVAPGYYRIALRHRNHLAVMSVGDYSLQLNDLSTVNFRIANVLYGTSPSSVVGSTRCLWPGDANFDGTVKYAGGANDRDPILTLVGGTTPTSTVNNVYNGADLNLDGTVKYAGSANDRDIILQTVGGSVPTATRTQQLP